MTDHDCPTCRHDAPGPCLRVRLDCARIPATCLSWEPDLRTRAELEAEARWLLTTLTRERLASVIDWMRGTGEPGPL